jgi:hypothetical protein
MKRKKRKQRMGIRGYRLEEMGLASTKATAQTLRLASNWTPEQATAVYETLDDLLDVIWRSYGPQIQRTLRIEWLRLVAGPRRAEIDDDVPF